MKREFRGFDDGRERTTEEKLFFMMMHAPHIIRRSMDDGRGHCGPRHGHGPEGHGCSPRHGHGPEGHGCGPRHGMEHGHGPHHGHMRGPNPQKMRAFAQRRLLSVLLGYEDGVRQKVLAEEMRINPSSISELISKLEAEGYAARTVDPDDKRATLITLTEVGKARAYELEDERNERFAKPFANLNDQEKDQLLKLLEKLITPVEE